MSNENSYGANENYKAPSREAKASKAKEQKLTYDDYAALEDDLRYELADGVLELMSPGPNSVHQVVLSRITQSLLQSCSEQYFILFAPIDLILSNTEVRQPDLMLIGRSREHIIEKRGVTGPPDLVAEILSPSTLNRDKVRKSRVYAEYEIPEYWIVDPFAESLEQYTLVEGKYELNYVYQRDEPVVSANIRCAALTMEMVFTGIPTHLRSNLS